MSLGEFTLLGGVRRDEGRTPIRAADNTVSDLIEIESAPDPDPDPDPEQVQDILARISQGLAGPENTELRRALAVRIRRVVLARLAPDIELPPITELAEVQAMLSGNVIPWNVRAMEKGLQQGIERGLQKGRQEGLIEGRTDLARGTLERQLTCRFGP